MILVAVASAALISVVQASFFEWAFHRYWLHRPWLPKNVFTAHTLVHHQLCKHDDTFYVVEEEQEEALHFQWWGGPVLIAINMVPWMLIGWGLSSLGVVMPYWTMLAVGVGTFFLYYLGYEGFHNLMHRPRLPFIERSRWFRFLERHHRIHHVHMDRNLNVLLPLADLVLGTLITESTTSAPTPQAARTLARRHSRFGRNLHAGEAQAEQASDKPSPRAGMPDVPGA